MLACAGARKCPLRGWVHPSCAKRAGDSVTKQMVSGSAEFWCSFCGKEGEEQKLS